MLRSTKVVDVKVVPELRTHVKRDHYDRANGGIVHPRAVRQARAPSTKLLTATLTEI